MLKAQARTPTALREVIDQLTAGKRVLPTLSCGSFRVLTPGERAELLQARLLCVLKTESRLLGEIDLAPRPTPRETDVHKRVLTLHGRISPC